MNESFSHSPNSLDLSGKEELLVFALTFLTSTWYIKNPFLKSKINEVCTWNDLDGQLLIFILVGGVLRCPTIRK